MSRVEEILTLTQELHETVDNHNVDQASEIVNEIQQFLEVHDVEDTAYYEITEDIEEVEQTLAAGELSSNDWIAVSVIGQQVDELYLRHHRQEADTDKSVTEIKQERDLFRQIAIRYVQDLDELVDHVDEVHEELKKKAETNEKLRRIIDDRTEKRKERINRMAEDILGSDYDKTGK